MSFTISRNSVDTSTRVRMLVTCPDHGPQLTARLSRLLAAQQLLDVSLAAEGRVIRAHRVVLAAASKYFEVGIQ